MEERDVASSSASVDASSGHKSPPPHDPPGAKRELSYDSSSVFDEAPSVELNTDNDQEGSDDDSDYDSEVRPTLLAATCKTAQRLSLLAAQRHAKTCAGVLSALMA